MREANILDPVEETLDQRVFDGTTPKPRIVNFIKRIYYRNFSQTFGVDPSQVSSFVQLVLTGSLTTYQYSDTSDCDIAAIADFNEMWEKLGLPPDEARKALIAMNIDHLDGTFLPGGSHPLQFFTPSEGIGPDDQFKPGLRSGYDLQAKQWIVPPEKDRSHDVAMEFPDVYQRASEIADKMSTMLDAGDSDRAIELWKQVHKKRQLDQRAGLGDFCEGNIVYKWLVHTGLVERLRHELGLQIATHFKEAMPPASEVHNFLQEYQQTPRAEEQPDDAPRGYDWTVNIPALRQLFYMPNSPLNHVALKKIEICGPHQQELWTNTFGWYDSDAATIWLHPFLAAEQANFTLWHEIQHAYQFAEERMNLENYKYPSNKDLEGEEEFDDAQYYTHPVEVDANEFAEVMAQNWLIISSPPLDDKDWVPPELHLDRGEWNDLDELWELTPEQLHEELAAQVKYFRTSYRFWQGTWEGYEDRYGGFQMPPAALEQFLRVMECPECKGNLLREGDDVWCPHCSWSMKTSKTAAMHILYDFEKDRITLGSKESDLDTKIVGEYDEGQNAATLYEAEKQWINPTHFRRLWNYSYPKRPLKEVHFQRGDNKRKLKTRDHPHHERHLHE